MVQFQNRFVALDVSLQLIEALAPIVPAIERHDRSLADQIRRAASSVSLNLSEGERSAKGNKPKHYAIAHGSAGEVRAALEAAIGWGWIERSAEVERLVDHLLRLLWGLTH